MKRNLKPVIGSSICRSAFIRRAAVAALVCLAICLAICPPFAVTERSLALDIERETQDPNVELLKDVWEKLLAVTRGPAGVAWPPMLHILNEGEMKLAGMSADSPNAFATVCVRPDLGFCNGAPVVCVNRSLLERAIEGNADRLAFILGHELSHITLGHLKRRPAPTTSLLATFFSRDRESAADLAGIKAALAAGYSFKEAIGAGRRFVELGLEYPPLWPVDHPSWTQRLAALDKQRSTLWQSMGGFNNGVLFLSVEQYVSAEKCFAAVVKEFPDCYEAQANLGYARLMQYCDLLTADDVREFDIGHIMIGGFYSRPDSLIEKARGKNVELWRQAVEALETALRIKPDLALARANLGIAYLVRPEGRDVERASRYLQDASALTLKGGSPQPVLRSIVLVNLGVADVAAGRSDLGDQRFREAYNMAGSIPAIRATVLYNYALSLLRKEGSTTKRDAAKALSGYLQMSDPASIWWKLAFERYSKLCGEERFTCLGEQEIRAKTKQSFRPIPAVDLGAGVLVRLGDAMSQVEQRLGGALSVPIVRGAKLTRLRFVTRGIDVIGSDEVFAIALNSPRSPSLELQRTGTGAQKATLRVGMTEQELGQVLGASSHAATIFNPVVRYRSYPEVGVAVRTAQGRVAELLVVLIPRQAGG